MYDMHFVNDKLLAAKIEHAECYLTRIAQRSWTEFLRNLTTIPVIA